MFHNEVLYSLDDVAIVPSDTSDVDHRANCNPYKVLNEKKYLPIFTAPMFNVVGPESMKVFDENRIIPILPRVDKKVMSVLSRVELSKKYWCAFGLDEFISNFSFGKTVGVHYVLVDIANGNMNKLIRGIRTAKENNPELVIMAGNVANPKTYVALAYAGADYVRVSVGSGSVCTTASNLGIFYGMASLISECYNRKHSKKLTTKIVADGGIKGSRYILKALALGADFVMCGGLFNKAFESSGNMYRIDGTEYVEWSIPYDDRIALSEDEKKEWIDKGLYKNFFGMSTKTAQKEMGSSNLKTGEGKHTRNKIEYTLKGWTENIRDFIRSAMSYCNITDIEDFNPENVDTYLLSPTAAKAFND
jgi:hypothetical protein